MTGPPSAAPVAGAAGHPRPFATDAAAVAARATVPVLCWHQLRSWRPSDSDYNRQLLICPPERFAAQLDVIAAAGYTTIGPDDYLAHLTHGTALPDKPVILSFDDAQGSQVAVGLPALRRRGMTGTFFVMTVVLDKPGWMSRRDVRTLHRAGMTVASHTWDHHRADRYGGRDWVVQLQQPRALLEQLTGAPVRHFAYPYGLWAERDFAHLQQAGYATAFQLGGRLDRHRPLYTLRRILVPSTATPSRLRSLLSAAV